MKQLVLGFALTLFSASSFAQYSYTNMHTNGEDSTKKHTVEFCAWGKSRIEDGKTILPLRNKAYKETLSNTPSHIVCGSSAGNNLFVNKRPNNYGYYNSIVLEKDCQDIVAAMDANPTSAFEFYIEYRVLKKVTKSKTRLCDKTGRISEYSFVLDLGTN